MLSNLIKLTTQKSFASTKAIIKLPIRNYIKRTYNNFGDIKTEYIDTSTTKITRKYNDFGDLIFEEIIDKNNESLKDSYKLPNKENKLRNESKEIPQTNDKVLFELISNICISIWNSDAELRKNVTNYIYKSIDNVKNYFINKNFNIKHNTQGNLKDFNINNFKLIVNEYKLNDKQILNIPENEILNNEILHKYYIKKLKTCHPDINKNNNALEQTKLVITAYNNLLKSI